MKEKIFSCVDCGSQACEGNDKTLAFPESCTANRIKPERKVEVGELYKEKENNEIVLTAAKIEGNYYGKLSRVEETILFIKNMGYKKIGVVCCVGVLKEARIFSNLLRDKGFDVISAACKIASADKTVLGIVQEDKICPHQGENYCNPIMQAKLMKDEGVDFIVAMGLCVGHDVLFLKYVDIPTTVLFAKDRITGHNPAAVLYNAKSYYEEKLKKI